LKISGFHFFFQKNKFSDSDESEIELEGLLWQELDALNLAMEFGLGMI